MFKQCCCFFVWLNIKSRLQSRNPFEEEEQDDKEAPKNPPKSNQSKNPFEFDSSESEDDEEDENEKNPFEEQSSDEESVKGNNPFEEEVEIENPFGSEEEEFVKEIKAPEEKPSTPRTRAKKKAPLPPTTANAPSPKTKRAPQPPAGAKSRVSNVTSQDGVVTSQRKKQAPCWKEEVERKMREANMSNLQDEKFDYFLYKYVFLYIILIIILFQVRRFTQAAW